VFLFHANGFLGARHASDFHPSPIWAFVVAGQTGVSLFFVLSAFLLSLPFFEAISGNTPAVSLRRFYTRRALRILPLYYAVVIVTTVASASTFDDLRRGVPYLFFLNSISLTMAQLPFVTGVWWSLGTEAQFYALLPLLGVMLGSRARRIAGAIGLAIYAGAYVSYVLGLWRMATWGQSFVLGASVFGRGPLFLYGIAAAGLFHARGPAMRGWMERRSWLRRGGADLGLLAVVGGLGWVLSAAIGGRGWYEGPRDIPWHLAEGAAWTAVVLLLLLAPLSARCLLVNRWMEGLGRISYSMYLLHLPLILLARALLGGSPQFTFSRPAGLLGYVAVFSACVAASTLTYHLIERPFLVRKASLEQ
jgi:peptidoglycan/LPS O-acetylase OafA/YrhL